MKVCVDAGHGGTDPGAVGTQPFRLAEKDFTLSLALLVEEELESGGHWTVMTRRRDRALGLAARATFANRAGADLFLSLHANSAAVPEVAGMEVFHFPGSRAGRAAALRVLRQLLSAFPDHANRGVKEADFAVLRETQMPAILVECEFLTNPRQLRFLASPANQRRLALALARGVDGLERPPT
jgi:N-acetylmuramoyl-L-alanine amidase